MQYPAIYFVPSANSKVLGEEAKSEKKESDASAQKKVSENVQVNENVSSAKKVPTSFVMSKLCSKIR